MASKNISRYFSRSEFACKCGCGFDTIDAETLELLDSIRWYYKLPVIVTSGCRCESYNELVGGSPQSQHLKGRAADILVKNIKASDVASWLIDKYKSRYGIGSYSYFTHIDTRTGVPKRWYGK